MIEGSYLISLPPQLCGAWDPMQSAESALAHSAQHKTSDTCEDDRCSTPSAATWHCVDCDSNYCDDCWAVQGPHRAGKLGRDGVPHEKTNVATVTRLKDILQPPQSPDSIRASHERDQRTKWFGVSRDVTGRPSLDDYGRYATLMGSLQPSQAGNERYPQLVSFIGITNAGKSTIIKMLVNHRSTSGVVLPTPVAGSMANDKVPTSGDVHLYADYLTHATQLPILYADCEGFEGGEKLPMGARIKRRPRSNMHSLQPELYQSRSLPIEWAETEDTRRREYAVKELYPRLLYTFSDVVVFVMRNPKTFQSAVLGNLLDWGASALEKSLNQPALPHAIVLLNDTEHGVDEREWDCDYATASLLLSVSGSLEYLEGVPRFRELAQYWRDRGKQINSVQDLILRYYASFKVVRIPRKPRYMLMDRQIGRLHNQIVSCCHSSHQAKRKARLLMRSEELNIYLQSAFEHFTRTLAVPFNFVAVSLLNNPISFDFGGHVLQLAKVMTATHAYQQETSSSPQRLFEMMCRIVASCVVVDCVRYRKGKAEDSFDSYSAYFDWTLREFCEMWLPCEFSSTGGRRCQVVKARHGAKGHQDSQGIICHGDFEAALVPENYSPIWQATLRTTISAIQEELQREQDFGTSNGLSDSDEKIALRLHRHNLCDFFAGTAQEAISHASCFCCLMEVPEHPLPCGHVLCTACVQAYGKPSGKSAWELSYCPLHMEQTRWSIPCRIEFKHKAAGTRVLCLDGGGVRGIVQLEVLRNIEQALGGDIPIQSFFDLIVGTSTGGILAIALGVQQWPVDRCISMFASLCQEAYVPRMKGIPLLDFAAAVSHGSKYKTKAFHGALKNAFGDQNFLFGVGTRSKPSSQTKVAVTSTSSTGSNSIVLANYRRKEDITRTYDFERPHKPELELRVWEAAAATSATPTFFKPFINPHTMRTHLDGVLSNSNPAQVAEKERRLIWPETADRDPDIFLSLGTGQNRISILPKLSTKETDNTLTQPASTTNKIDHTRGPGHLFKSWSLNNRVDDVLQAEQEWTSFRSEVIDAGAHRCDGKRYIRFNPDLGKPVPSMDARDRMQAMQWAVKSRLSLQHCCTAVQHVAHRLVASSFFLDVQQDTILPDGSHSFKCIILCRFENGTSNLRAFGRYLRKASVQGSRPYFIVKGDAASDKGVNFDLTEDVIDKMVEHADFPLSTINITVEDTSKLSDLTLVLTPDDGLEPPGFSVSGFPKNLVDELKTKSGIRKHAKSPASSVRAPSPLRSSHPETTDSKTASLDDTISLDHAHSRSSQPRELWAPSAGPLAGLKQSNHAAAGVPMHIKQTLDHQISYREVKRPNRFWTYIGPQHMAKNPHLYPPEVLRKFLPSSEPEAVELDACKEIGITHVAYSELDGGAAKPGSFYHELEGDSPPFKTPSTLRARSDSARSFTDTVSVTEAIMGKYTAKVPALPGFDIPPAFPPRKRGFDRGELETALQAALH